MNLPRSLRTKLWYYLDKADNRIPVLLCGETDWPQASFIVNSAKTLLGMKHCYVSLAYDKQDVTTVFELLHQSKNSVMGAFDLFVEQMKAAQ